MGVQAQVEAQASPASPSAMSVVDEGACGSKQRRAGERGVGRTDPAVRPMRVGRTEPVAYHYQYWLLTRPKQ
jgi:hypothetical protein